MSILTATDLAKAYGPDDIFDSISVEIPHKARIALVGPNGAGKTTLLNILVGKDTPTEGNLTIAKGTRIGFLPQRPELAGTHDIWEEMLKAFGDVRRMEARLRELETRLDDAATLEQYGELQHRFELADGYNYENRIKQVLHGLGFKPEDYTRPLPKLSGGQRTRVLLGRLLLDAPDLLVLDEPTNHLDIASQEVLQDVLAGFSGTILLVSHDRYLVDALATQIWAASPGKLDVFEGTYKEFVTARQTLAAGEALPRKASVEPSNGKGSTNGTVKKSSGNQRQLEKRIAEAEAKVHQLESKLSTLTTEIEKASQQGNAARVHALGEDYARTEEALEAAMNEWGELVE